MRPVTFTSAMLTAILSLTLPSCDNKAPGTASRPAFETAPGANDKLDALEFEEEARRILDFWVEKMPDAENGGFYGQVDSAGQVDPLADKAGILNTRILWTFAAAGQELGDTLYRRIARESFYYLSDNFIDPDYGGLYWMLDYRGKPKEMRKQVYAQAFAIYAFSECYLLTELPKALDEAVTIFRLLEKYAYDPEFGGYFDSFSREWQRMDQTLLGDDETRPAKTMNTHLHLLEAFTNLYRAWKDETLKERLRELIVIHLDKILDEENAHLDLFFNADWSMKGEKIISYGHDIEASWLLTEAAEVLGDEPLLDRVRETAVKIAAATLEEGFDPDGGLLYEATPEGVTNTGKHWWPQAEALVGFYNAFQLTGKSPYRDAAKKSWTFIQEYLVDREHGEWRWMVTREGIPGANLYIAGPWKAPYHNTRSCLEMRRRLNEGQQKDFGLNQF